MIIYEIPYQYVNKVNCIQGKTDTSSWGRGLGRCSRTWSIWSIMSLPVWSEQTSSHCQLDKMRRWTNGKRDEDTHPDPGMCLTPLGCSLAWAAPGTTKRVKHVPTVQDKWCSQVRKAKSCYCKSGFSNPGPRGPLSCMFPCSSTPHSNEWSI